MNSLWFAGVSSATRTRSSNGVSGLAAGAAAADSMARAWMPSRVVKRKMLPLPGSLSTQIRPPMRSTRRRLMVSPKPVPPYWAWWRRPPG